jgi:crotonobetainyl-CoA:carnitine CoA-transferase CaiB-like acyl-CoA transferase
MKRLGLDYETLRGENPGLVYCSVTGYGQTGPCRDRVGHDVNYLARSGVLDLMGESDRLPAIPAIQIADMVGGGMNAACGILLALMARGQSGRGQHVDISMTDGMVSMLPVAQFVREFTGQVHQRGNSFLSHRYACYNTYETKDNRCITIGAIEARFWKKLCDHMGVPEYTALQNDESRRVEIIDFMRKKFREKSLDEWTKELGSLDVCWAPVQNLDEALEDPLFREREMVVDLKGENGEKLTTLGIPVKLSETPGSIRTPPAKFGADTTQILQTLGYSIEEVHQLSEKNVI